MLLFFKRLFKKYSPKDQKLSDAIRSMVGVRPHNLSLYRLAMQHSSVAHPREDGTKESNERLEFLGDAVIGMVVAGYLFKRFPYKDEGFLTEIRSRIVSRESLGSLAITIGINKITEFYQDKNSRRQYKSVYGNALEALIGAVYLDRGYTFCKKFIIAKLLTPHFDLKEVVRSNPNFKSKIIEWAQQQNKDVAFEISEMDGQNNFKEFNARLLIDNEFISEGNGPSKKKAEQDAAYRASDKLNLANPTS